MRIRAQGSRVSQGQSRSGFAGSSCRDLKFQHPNPPQQALTQTEMGGIPVVELQWPCPQPPSSGRICAKLLLSPASVPNTAHPTAGPAPNCAWWALRSAGMVQRGNWLPFLEAVLPHPACRRVFPTRPGPLGHSERLSSPGRQAGRGISSPVRSIQVSPVGHGQVSDPWLRFPAQPKGPVHQTYLGR